MGHWNYKWTMFGYYWKYLDKDKHNTSHQRHISWRISLDRNTRGQFQGMTSTMWMFYWSLKCGLCAPFRRDYKILETQFSTNSEKTGLLRGRVLKIPHNSFWHVLCFCVVKLSKILLKYFTPVILITSQTKRSVFISIYLWNIVSHTRGSEGWNNLPPPLLLMPMMNYYS